MDESNPEAVDGKVVDIKKGRGKGPKPKNDNDRPEKSDKVKLKQAQVHLAIADAMIGSPASALPRFPVRLGVLEPEPGKRLAMRINAGDEVELVGRDYVQDAIIRYAVNELGAMPDLLVTARTAADIARYWLALAQPIDAADVAYTRWQSEPGLTYRRLPWAKGSGATPTWDDLLSTMTNVEAFKDWIGSLFFLESNSHNYVWIYGEGGDGKGTINRFLHGVFGKSYQAKTAPSCDPRGTVDKFWAYNLLTARLAAFPDCDNPSFTSSGIFKSVTGGDPIPMEQKGGIAFTGMINARCLVLANCQPAITGERSNTRRIIYCELEALERKWAGIQDRLWDEGGLFLSNCVAQYSDKYPEHTPIKTDQTVSQDAITHVVADNEQHFTSFFETYFELKPDGSATPGDLQTAANEAWPHQRKMYVAFLSWLKRTHGVFCRVRKITESTTGRFYEGIGRRRVVLPTRASTRPEWGVSRD